MLDLDPENKRISLSIKELTERPAKQPVSAPSEDNNQEVEESIPSVNEEMNATIGDFMNN